MRTVMLGIPIDSVTMAQAREIVADFLRGNVTRKIFTPNPEMLVAAWRNPEFGHALKQADLAVPDGAGLVLASKLYGRGLTERVTGTDLMSETCEIAAQNGLGVFLLGGGEGVARQAAKELTSRYPKLKVVGAMSGGQVGRGGEGRPMLEPDVKEAILSSGPAVLFVAFGHGAQEEWITEHADKFPSVRVAMGVGGAFDFHAKKISRAPYILRHWGFEWLWRLILQPSRIKRILTAIIVFPLLVVGERVGLVKAKS